MLDAKTGTFSRKMQQASRQSKMLGGGVSFLNGKLAALGGLLVGGITIRGLTNMIGTSMKLLDVLAKTSDKLGIDSKALAGLQHAANITGVSVETLTKGLQNMARRVAEATEGTGEGVDALNALGLSAETLSGMSADRQFFAIADAMGRIGSQGKKVQIAFDLFGRGGVDLLNTMALGSDGLRSMSAEMDRLGGAIGRVDLAKVEQANDSIARAKTAFRGLANEITIGLAPTIEVIAEQSTKWLVAQNDGLGESVAWIKTFNDGLILAAKNFNNWRALWKMVEMASKKAKQNDQLIYAMFGKDPKEVAARIKELQKEIKALKNEIIAIDNINKGMGKSFAENLKRVREAAEKARQKAKGAKPGTDIEDDVEASLAAKTRAEQIAEMVKSPLEKYREIRDEIDKLVKDGFLDDATALKALKMHLEDARSAMAGMEESKNEFLGFGQGQAKQVNFATGFRANNPVSAASAQANRLAQSIANATQQGTNYLRQIAENTSGGTFATVAPG